MCVGGHNYQLSLWTDYKVFGPEKQNKSENQVIQFFNQSSSI